jgi:hypothetical protein
MGKKFKAREMCPLGRKNRNFILVDRCELVKSGFRVLRLRQPRCGANENGWH